jgi:nucleotide-binding universal stress UspA family protein
MQQILVGVDGSEHAMNAVDQAATIAAAFDAHLHLFVVAPPIASVSEWLEFYKESGHLLDELPRLFSLVEPAFLGPAAARARAKGATKISTQFTAGDPVTELLVAAQEMKADLIVVGSHGRGRLSGLLLGSVSQKLAVHATCSVLIVR